MSLILGTVGLFNVFLKHRVLSYWQQTPAYFFLGFLQGRDSDEQQGLELAAKARMEDLRALWAHPSELFCI